MSYFTYKSFFNKKEAIEFSTILTQNGITNRIDTIGDSNVSSFTGTQIIQYAIQIDNNDKSKINDFFSSFNQIDLDHPFNEYKNEELIDILQNKDEWNINEITITEQLLTKRGIDSSEEVKQKYDEKIERLKEQKKGNVMYLIGSFLGSITCLFFGFSLVGMIGFSFFIGIGINYYLNKKTLPTGEKIFEYDKSTRKIGLYIIIFNIICILTYAIFMAKLYL